MAHSLRVAGAMLWALALCAGVAHAHENLPASLMVQEVQEQLYSVRWRVPQTQGPAPDISPRFPSDCTPATVPSLVPAPSARLSLWQIRCTQGLPAGSRIVIEGLGATTVDALVRVEWRDGSHASAVARPRAPDVEMGHSQAQSMAVSGYFRLGAEHILSGIDHLLFVLCLVMLVPHVNALIKTITAFTVAHSVTLALAALQWVQVPLPPMEASIALSILFLARELARRNQGQSMAIRRPWAVALAFGLLHGFGFAGALAEVGLPQGDIPVALLLFNLGVEVGQLVFVSLAYPALLLWRRRPQRRLQWMSRAPVYAVGAVAGFWWLQRMLMVVGVQVS